MNKHGKFREIYLNFFEVGTTLHATIIRTIHGQKSDAVAKMLWPGNGARVSTVQLASCDMVTFRWWCYSKEGQLFIFDLFLYFYQTYLSTPSDSQS